MSRRNRMPLLALVLAGVSGLPSTGRPADPDPALARKAQDILKANCYRCHGQNGSVEGGLNYVLDVKTLVARKKIVPGDPAKSRLLKRVRNPFEFDVLAHLAAERLGVREEMLRSEGTPEPAVAPAPVPQQGGGAEALLVELMASDPGVVGLVRAENVLGEFEHDGWRRAAEGLLLATDDAGRDRALEELPRDLRDRVVRRLLGEYAEEDRGRAVDDCVAAIRARRQRREQGRLREMLRAAEARGDEPTAAAVMRQLKELTEKVRT